MIPLLISVLCPDRTGLVSAIAGRLFDLGANLGDTSFAVLGAGAEFTSVCHLPDDVSETEVRAELSALPELAGADIAVTRFSFEPDHGPSARISHTITISGGDRPGLIARLSEVFATFHANIVRMEAQRVVWDDTSRYLTRFAVAIPPGSAASCLATVANTAGELGLSCRWSEED